MNLFDEPLLTPAEETRLGRLIEAGVLAAALLDGTWESASARGATPAELEQIAREGRRAYERFARANLRLVAQLARHEASRLGLNHEELFQEGVVGLLEAIQRWDHRRGLRFTTYAVVRVRNRIGAAAAVRCGELHVSRHEAATVHAVQGIARELEQAGRPASVGEVARRSGLGERTAAAWLAYAAPAPLTDAVVASFAAPDADPAQAACVEAAVDVAGLLAELPEPARSVLTQRYGIGCPRRTYDQIATRLGCSPRTVMRMEQRALEELRGLCPAQRAA